MNAEDLMVLKSVAKNFVQYDWFNLADNDELSSCIEFPSNAEKDVKGYYAQVEEGLIIVTGSYSFRFYYEEENFNWEKMSFAAILSNEKNEIAHISFITNEDYEIEARKEMFGDTEVGFMERKVAHYNIITNLYDSVNRKVIGVSNLYQRFLNKDI